MLEESLVQQPTLIWNTVRGVWEKPMASLLCEHWELFSEAWPTSGMMQNGLVYELPMQERHTADSESSLQQLDNLPTPKARDSQPEGYEAGLRRSSPQVGTIVKGLVDGDERVIKLPTPTTMDAKATNNPEVIDKFLLQGKQTFLSYELLRSPKASEGQGGALGEAEALKRGNTVGVRDQVMDLVASQGKKVSRVADNLMPTPTTRDYKDGQAEHKRDGVIQTDTVARAVFNSGEVTLIGTPRATAADSSSIQVANGAPKGRIEDQVKLTDWGKFEPAIRRWEQTLGLTAPEPTKPDGKEDAHRLSSKFTEWMMGLEPGWITDCGLTRNEELKAAGNGVVPQQAELALRILLGFDIPKALERERVNSDSNCLSCQYARRTDRNILDTTSEIINWSDWKECGCGSQDGNKQVNLPTPTVSDTFTDNLASSQQKEGSMHSVTLPQAVKMLVQIDLPKDIE